MRYSDWRGVTAPPRLRAGTAGHVAETIAFASTPVAITRAMTTVMPWRYVAETGARVTEKSAKVRARNGAPPATS